MVDELAEEMLKKNLFILMAKIISSRLDLQTILTQEVCCTLNWVTLLLYDLLRFPYLYPYHHCIGFKHESYFADVLHLIMAFNVKELIQITLAQKECFFKVSINIQNRQHH